ncbi:MAG: hypothetical protein JXP34_14030 [Planctomycetes bacterium]|nr:hypothetical protein [Planctomycetota bacterium]
MNGGVPFSSNAIRLSPREAIAAGLFITAALVAIPIAWEKIEPLGAGEDYRVPFRLGSDYWTYGRWTRAARAAGKTLVIGDSVVWGHYVASGETLSAALNAASGGERFANLGVDGIHPAALAGLMRYYGGAIRGCDCIVQMNPLWLSSPRHDLSTDKEFTFNHPMLVPQFFPSIPCYAESFDGRLGNAIARRLPAWGWANHIRIAYFGDTDLAGWALAHPYENPLRAITLSLPSPDEPPDPVPVAKPWTEQGIARFRPPWVDLETSFQWRSFREAVRLLSERGNRVFVLVGPFNEHMLEDESLRTYETLKGGIAAWLREQGIPHAVPAALPSEVYADASHPIAEGYRTLADRLLEDQDFRRFLDGAGGGTR